MINKKILDKTFKHIVEGSPEILSTGFYDFDIMLSAIDYGSLITISGQRSIGKTALLLNMMYRLINKQNKKCLFFSLELSTELIIKRLLSCILEIPHNRFFVKEHIKPENIERIKSTMQDLEKLDLTIFEDIIDTNAIEAEIKKHKPEYVFIDSIELIHELNLENKQNIVNGVFVKLKDIAMENNCIIIDTCALPHKAKQRKHKYPVLSDLRECGGSDVVSDTVIFIYRDIYTCNMIDDTHCMAELIFAKNRNGTLGTINLYFAPKYGKFYSYGDVKLKSSEKNEETAPENQKNDGWKAKKYITATELEEFINQIKPQLLDKPVEKIIITGNLFSYDERLTLENGKYYDDTIYDERDGRQIIERCETEYVEGDFLEEYCAELDEPAIIYIGGTQFEINFIEHSLAQIGINTIKEGETFDNYYKQRDISYHYAKNIIKHKVKDIYIKKTKKVSISWEVERKPGDDMYEKIIFVLDNGYKLEIWCFTDYMEIEEVKP